MAPARAPHKLWVWYFAIFLNVLSVSLFGASLALYVLADRRGADAEPYRGRPFSTAEIASAAVAALPFAGLAAPGAGAEAGPRVAALLARLALGGYAPGAPDPLAGYSGGALADELALARMTCAGGLPVECGHALRMLRGRTCEAGGVLVGVADDDGLVRESSVALVHRLALDAPPSVLRGETRGVHTDLLVAGNNFFGHYAGGAPASCAQLAASASERESGLFRAADGGNVAPFLVRDTAAVRGGCGPDWLPCEALDPALLVTGVAGERPGGPRTEGQRAQPLASAFAGRALGVPPQLPLAPSLEPTAMNH